MSVLLYVLVGLLLWMLVGCVLLATIDTRGELLAWTKEAPYGLGVLVILLWPIVIVVFLRRKVSDENTLSRR